MSIFDYLVAFFQTLLQDNNSILDNVMFDIGTYEGMDLFTWLSYSLAIISIILIFVFFIKFIIWLFKLFGGLFKW